jgi:hypothetical protein
MHVTEKYDRQIVTPAQRRKSEDERHNKCSAALLPHRAIQVQDGFNGPHGVSMFRVHIN